MKKLFSKVMDFLGRLFMGFVYYLAKLLLGLVIVSLLPFIIVAFIILGPACILFDLWESI